MTFGDFKRLWAKRDKEKMEVGPKGMHSELITPCGRTLMLLSSLVLAAVTLNRKSNVITVYTLVVYLGLLIRTTDNAFVSFCVSLWVDTVVDVGCATNVDVLGKMQTG